MEKRISPFSTTPGIAGKAYINIGIADEIISNFDSNYSTQYVFKILGLRGSGKSVEYKRVMDYFSEKENWKVYALAAGGEPTTTLISAIGRELGMQSYDETVEKSSTGSIEGNISVIKGGLEQFEKHKYEKKYLYSEEDTLRKMCSELSSKGYKILIGVDDIAATAPMIDFLSILGTFFMDNKIEIRLIVTGLQNNLEKFNAIPHLSFFARPKACVVSTLNLHDVTRMYQSLIGVEKSLAEKLADISKGYACGYQLLGDEYYNIKAGEGLDEVLQSFDLRMAPTYDLMWNTLTPAERGFVKEILDSDTGKRDDLKKKISGYSQHRNDLKKKHILADTEPGIVKINLPRFREYIAENHDS